MMLKASGNKPEAVSFFIIIGLKPIAYLIVLQKKTWKFSKSFFVIYFKTFRCLLCRNRNRNVYDLRLRKLFCGHRRK